MFWAHKRRQTSAIVKEVFYDRPTFRHQKFGDFGARPWQTFNFQNSIKYLKAKKSPIVDPLWMINQQNKLQFSSFFVLQWWMWLLFEVKVFGGKDLPTFSSPWISYPSFKMTIYLTHSISDCKLPCTFQPFLPVCKTQFRTVDIWNQLTKIKYSSEWCPLSSYRILFYCESKIGQKDMESLESNKLCAW